MRAVLFALLLAGSAVAQPRHVITSGVVYTTPPAPPTTLNWRLATAGNQFVDATFGNLPYNGGQTAFVATPDSPLNFNFAAWQAAANNPAYNRSIFTFGGLTQERPWSHEWAGGFDLDRISLFVDTYHQFSGHIAVSGFLTDFLEVPEPSSIALLLSCFAVRIRRN